MAEIVELISTVGFPIAMCLLVFYSNEKTIKQLEQTINKLNKTMSKILLKLGVQEDDDE